MSKTVAVAALLAFALSLPTLCPPARAQEIQPPDGPDLLETLGDFLRSGLAPPRTAADLAREEEKARQAALTAPVVVPVAPAPAPVVEPPAAAPVSPEQPTPPAPEQTKPPAPVVTAPPAPVREPPPAAAAPPPPSRPTPIVVPRPAAEPIPEADRIAGTATLDQAVKLGGPLELYTRRSAKPAGN